MAPVGFEPKISVGERPQTYALDRVATGTSSLYLNKYAGLFKSPSGISELTAQQPRQTRQKGAYQ